MCSLLPASASARGFVTVRDHRLWLDGGPFYFIGANVSLIHGSEREQYIETLVNARLDGVMVARIWALGEGDGTDEPHRQASLFRNGPDDWNERAFVHLDRVIAVARTLGLKLIIVLSNAWADYGGVPMYLRWSGQTHTNDPGAADRFYTDPEVVARYREHVRRVVGRVSSLDGRPYRDEPSIMGWELMNESTVSREGVLGRRTWIASMAEYVHTLDPNHLVTIGHQGYRTAREREDWIADHQVQGIDYCDHHLYMQPDVPIHHPGEIAAHIAERVQLARERIGKPIVIGEIGFRPAEAQALGESRGGLFARAFEAARAAGAAGMLAWIYLPPGVVRDSHGIPWGPSDDPEAAGSEDVRDAIRRAARRAWRGPDLVSQGGAAPVNRFHLLARPEALVLEALRAAEDRRAVSIQLPARGASAARWERQGNWEGDGSFPAHAWGNDVGYFEYSFALPRGRPRSVLVRAKLSGERPGRVAPPQATSRVLVSLDGARLGDALAIADDGRGGTLELESSDPAVLARLAGGVGRLRFEVRDGPGANGLCIYEPGVEVEVRY